MAPRITRDYGWSGTFQVLAGVAMITCIGAAVYYNMQRTEH